MLEPIKVPEEYTKCCPICDKVMDVTLFHQQADRIDICYKCNHCGAVLSSVTEFDAITRTQKITKKLKEPNPNELDVEVNVMGSKYKDMSNNVIAVFDMLGVEPYEEFNVEGYGSVLYRFNDRLNLQIYEKKHDWWNATDPSKLNLFDFLNGDKTLLHRTYDFDNAEKIAMIYAKEAGYPFIQKESDELERVFAYKDNPKVVKNPEYIALFVEFPHLESNKVINVNNVYLDLSSIEENHK